MKMKKITALILAGVTAAAALGCGASSVAASSDSAVESTVAGTEESAGSTSSGGEVAAIQTRGTITMATNAEFEPFEYKDNDEVIGIDIDIAGKIAEDLGVELEVTDIAFDSLIPALNAGKADFIAAGMTATEDRKKNVDFSESYYNASQTVIVTLDSDITEPSDIEGKTVGVQQGTTGDVYCTNEDGSSEVVVAEVKRYLKPMDAVSDLIAGRLDAVVVDDFPATKLVEQNSDKVKKLEKPLTEEEYAMAFPKGSDLVDEANKVIEELKESGELDEIVGSYILTDEEESSEDASEDIEEESSSNSLASRLYDDFIYQGRWLYLVKGLGNTVLITVFALILGVILGFLVALVKVAYQRAEKKSVPLRIINVICDIYLALIRGTPVVVQLMIMYFVILSSGNEVVIAILSFGINSGAYVAEVLRSGIQSIDRGQTEAGRSLGLSASQTMRLIVLPQAFKNVAPAIFNEFIALLKETSVAGYVGIQDLTKGGDIIRSITYDAFPPLLAVALVYLVIVVILTQILHVIEGRLAASDLR